MRVTLYASFVALAASLAAASAVPSSGPTDAQIKELTRTRLEPPFEAPSPRTKDDVGWIYPSSDKVGKVKEDGKCSFNVIMDVSRCAGMSTKQEPVAYPYNSYSMDMLHGNMKFETGATSIAPFAQKTIKLTKCGFNGRLFLMDQFSDNIFATSRMSVRLTLEEGKATSWVTTEVDEETGIPQKRVAPLIRRFYGSDAAKQGGRITGDENLRGKAKTIMTTTNTTDNYLALQWC